MSKFPKGLVPTENSHLELITRGKVCQILDVSYSEFRRREKAGEVVFKGVRHDNGWMLYREHDVRAARRHWFRPATGVRRAQGMTTQHSYDADTAHRVFEALEKGLSPKDIVVQLRLHPNEVTAICATWQKMSGGVLVTAAIMGELAALIESEDAFRSGEDLYVAFKKALKNVKSACESCAKRPAAMCHGCVRKEVAGALPQASRGGRVAATG